MSETNSISSFKLLLKHLFTEADTALSLNDWYNFVSEK